MGRRLHVYAKKQSIYTNNFCSNIKEMCYPNYKVSKRPISGNLQRYHTNM